MLQIEAMDKVERAFVHVDYLQRDVPEHKVERTLLVDALKRRGHRIDTAFSVPEQARQHLVTAV